MRQDNFLCIGGPMDHEVVENRSEYFYAIDREPRSFTLKTGPAFDDKNLVRYRLTPWKVGKNTIIYFYLLEHMNDEDVFLKLVEHYAKEK